MSVRSGLIFGVALAWAVSVASAQQGSQWEPHIRNDGQPDIEGYYQASMGAGTAGLYVEPIPGNRNSRSMVVDPPDGRIPYLPWARARRDEVQNNQLHPTAGVVDTRTRGWPDGVPRISYYAVNPFQILQSAGAVLMLYEAQHEFRYIPVDPSTDSQLGGQTATPHLDPRIKLWMGSSRARWEGTTLVVDVRNMSDRVRFSVMGDFASDELKITERWTWLNRDTITLTATFDDPKVFSRPWTVSGTVKRITQPGFELMEYSGVEGDRDQHLQVEIGAGAKKAQDTK